MKQFLIIALLTIASHATAQKTMLSSFNVKINLPQGWTLVQQDAAYACYSADQASVILIVQDRENSLQYYDLALRTGVDLGDGITVKTESDLIPLTTHSAYSALLIIGPNGSAKGWGGLTQTMNEGTIGFVAIAEPAKLEEAKKQMLLILSSCEQLSETDKPTNSGLLQNWFNILTYSRLEGNYESYSSGYGGGGYSSSSSFEFCTNGSYKYTTEFSSSLSSPSVKTQTGSWTMRENAGSVILQLSSNNGTNSSYKLLKKEEVIYFNNAKYLQTRYRPDCN